MELNHLLAKVKEFDRKAGFDRTGYDELVKMMQGEVDALKLKQGSKNTINNKLIDILILVMQIGYRNGIEFDHELEKWFEK